MTLVTLQWIVLQEFAGEMTGRVPPLRWVLRAAGRDESLHRPEPSNRSFSVQRWCNCTTVAGCPCFMVCLAGDAAGSRRRCHVLNVGRLEVVRYVAIPAKNSFPLIDYT